MLRRAGRLLVALATVGLLLAAPVRAQVAALQAAEEAQAAGRIDEAIDLYRQAGESPALSAEDRQEALLQLARLQFFLKEDVERARTALAQTIALEPPQTPVDPDLDVYDFLRFYYKVRKEYAGTDAVERADPGIRVLALVDFDNSAIEDHDRLDPLRVWLASELSGALRDATDLRVVERQRLKYILEEHDLQRDPSRVDQQTAVRAGKLLGAHLMGMGTLMYMGREAQLGLRFVKVETGEIVTSVRVKGRLNDMDELVEQLAMKSAQALNVVLERTDLGSRTDVNSLDAVLAYSEGTRFEEDRQYVAAYEKYLEALEHDPEYAKARRKLEALQAMGLIAEARAGEGP